MPLRDMIRRASTYILGPEEDTKYFHYDDNEILFCKNNVCVHPPAAARHDTDILHHPGYLTITTKVFVDQYNESRRPTLFLTWIPNSTIAKNTSLIVDSPLRRSCKRSSVESLTSNDSNDYVERRQSGELRNTNPFLNYDEKDRLSESMSSDESEKHGISINVDISSPEIEIIQTPDSVKDPTEHFDFSRSESVTSADSQMNWVTTPEYLMQQHNLSFPESATNSPILHAKQVHKCRRFNVDLSQMRSLRLFFNDNSCTCGQLVVASRESQYKILHFHHGGLDHLAQVLHQWHSLLHSIKYAKGIEENLPYRHFMVCRPEVSVLELHPEEGQVPKLTEDLFRSLFNEVGQLEDDLTLRKNVFFSGMDRDIRKEVWPFLLHVYPKIVENNMIKKTILSDLETKTNIAIMKNILLNYAVYNPGLGYTQGMSDLLSPVLYELQDEVAAFWCFVGLMQRAVFVATPTDRDMDRCLRYLRELIRLMVPKFHEHLKKHKDATELLFCHRWILLCFKREFTEAVALRMWEACWANYLTDYFHLFLCLAIISVYADDVIAQDLRSDEMLLHFSSLAMYMDGQLIARKARGLLHQYRQMREIPCTLSGLCTRCGPGIWDSSHSPRIYCVGHEKEGYSNVCAY
nr:TBC1 domain family member 16 [Leptinotarsa decemlineata]